ncbi:putative reverse transcriptase domain-containing protein [Tanacetum coccineum]|uniref:Reverse transcriptase domain-containing protein n=1 Tax=Tanacetum coccineum TaxID=301880 RepID=A0ABQ5AVA8_9ASTR
MAIIAMVFRPRPAQTLLRECSYSEFLKCKPLDFKGTEGVVRLTRYDALTWWNSHVKTTTPEVAHAMPWAALKKMMTDKYCPRGEIKKIETEMWNLKGITEIGFGHLPGPVGHFKRNCPKLNNNDRGNQAGNNRAPAKVYAVGNAGANPDNVVAGTFLLNNRYAYILFDTGADRSFVSTAFSTLFDIIPNTLDHGL